ncbi:MAG: sulfatase [Candidatus Omnitrophica bacterium]|nr:sulfatase [Candidatus Omnitrophota bacterium]
MNQASDAPCNIVLLTLDAFRKDFLGCYGSSLGATPNIDSLAGESVVFDNAYSFLFGTDPVHTSILTGLWPWSHGIIHHGPWVSKYEKRFVSLKDDQFLPRILKESGYVTSAIDFLGRWYKTGFDYYSGSLRKNRMQSMLDFGHRAICKIFPRLPYWFLKHLPGTIAAYDYAEKVVEHAKGIIDKRPFFLFLHFWDTHTPYDPPPQYVRRFKHVKSKYNKKIKEIIDRISGPKYKRYMKMCTYSARSTDEIVQRYIGSLNYIDEQIGSLISYFKANNLFDNTMIIVTFDHGEGLGEHNAYFGHHTHFEEILKAALIIKFPKGAYKGSRVRPFARHIDVVPTILDFLNIKTNHIFDGESLLTLINEPTRVKPRPVLFGFMHERIGVGKRIGIIDNEWKYSFSLGPRRICPRCGFVHHQREELFNLKDDPQELVNLANEKKDLTKTLRQEIEKLINIQDGEIKKVLK